VSADTGRESRAEMMRRLGEGWSEIVSLVGSLAEDELEQPGVAGDWSVKDLLGHMAFWAEKAAGDLGLLATGRGETIETPGGEQAADEWNDREYRARKDRPLADVRAEWSRSFEDARRALEAAPEELVWQEVKGWPQAVRFREDTYNHYREHAEQIREWIRRTETSEA
jgi:uncharacterized protein (TIGR03083 family)